MGFKKNKRFYAIVSGRVEEPTVSLAPLDSPGASVTLVIGPIPEHCTFQYVP
jgi:hypothetical protein